MQMDENIIEVLDVAEIPDNNQSEKDEPEIKVNLFDYKNIWFLESSNFYTGDFKSWKILINAVYDSDLPAWYEWRQEDNLFYFVYNNY